MSDRIQKLQRLIDLIETRISILPAYSYEARAPYDAAVAKIINGLSEHEGAKFSERSGGSGAYAIRLSGIRASCTGGKCGTLTNWIAAARREIAKAEAAL